jgi:hypothetical protein
LSTTTRVQGELPELPLAAWEQTKNTLHLWGQIVGKVRLASTAPRNHWWHVPLYVDIRGLTTRRMHSPNGTAFQIDFDFVDHRLVVRTNEGELESFELVDGLSVADFDASLHAALGRLGIDVTIRETPYGVPMATPFPDDTEHDTYDPEAVERFWRVLDFTDAVFEQFAGWFCGKQSPVHIFWHSFDIALARFGGRRAPAKPDASLVEREAYSHEVIAFGFWAGDKATVGDATYYSYTSPEPQALREQRLRPDAARWIESGSGSLAVLPYDEVRTANDPRRALLEFLESTYEAGAKLAGWDRLELQSAWCPTPPELRELLGG